jgi:hypothetical protein
MQQSVKRIARRVGIALGIGGVLTALVLPADPAAAVVGQKVCGPGFSWVTSSIGAHGKLMQYTNKSSKQVCAILMSTGKASGTAKKMTVTIKLTHDTDRNGSPTGNAVVRTKTDSGTYKYYAGPVYVSYKGLNIKPGAVGPKAYSIVMRSSLTYKGSTQQLSMDGQM